MTLSLRSALPVLIGIGAICVSCEKVPAQTTLAAAHSGSGTAASSPAPSPASAPASSPAPAAAPQQAVSPGPTQGPAQGPSSSELYQTWQANNRSDHTVAYEAAQNYLKAYPDGAAAPELTRWSAAYEKVTGRTPSATTAAHADPATPGSPAGSPTALTPTPVSQQTAAVPQGFRSPDPSSMSMSGPPLGETQEWLIGWLNAHNHPTPDSWAAWKFDGCRLYVVNVRNGCYRRSMIDFSEVDPTALKAYSLTQGNSDSMAIMLRSSSEKPVYHADQAEKNLGALQSPVPGGACGKEAFDESPEPQDRTAQSYFVSNSTTDPFAKEDISHALNGVMHLVKLCGGKASPF